MVIDDYYGTDSNTKISPSRADVDALVAADYLEPLGSRLEHMGGALARPHFLRCLILETLKR